MTDGKASMRLDVGTVARYSLCRRLQTLMSFVGMQEKLAKAKKGGELPLRCALRLPALALLAHAI